jgi:hypothetical protein
MNKTAFWIYLPVPMRVKVGRAWFTRSWVSLRLHNLGLGSCGLENIAK